MCSIRDRKTAVAMRHRFPNIEVAATDPALPLTNINWAERWCTLPNTFEANIFEQLYNFEVRDDDVFVVTFFKCGTTWMQETAWLLMNHLNYERAKAEELLQRSIFLELTGLNKSVPNTIEMCDKQQSPRLIKCHLPVNSLPKQLWQKKRKIIYVARNVKDVVVSCYHHVKNTGAWTGSMDDFVQDFINNDIMYTPYLAHLVDFWRLRHEPYICFFTYEEMKQNLAGVIVKLCTFLERPQLTSQEMEEILQHLSFDKMRDNKRTNLTGQIKEVNPLIVNEKFQFMRRGIVGSYKDELNKEPQRLIDEWSKAYFAKYGIKEEDIFGKF